MKKRVLCSMFLFLFVYQIGIAQIAPEESSAKQSKEYFKKNPALKGILLGIHGARETMFEIGYFHYNWTENIKSKVPAIGGFGYAISTEHYINQNYIIAPKAAIWANVLYVNVGLSTPWYFDMDNNNSFRVRPEIGIGSGDFKLTYALNMAITNKDMPNISKHIVSAIFFLNFNKEAGGNKIKWF